MRLSITIGSEAIGLPVSPAAVVQQAVEAESSGFLSAWCTHFSRGIDALTTLAACATATADIELGVGVVPTYPRHPVALAQSAATVQALSGGRLVLGVGVSHRPVIEHMHGLDYSQQVDHLREYLTVLGGLLRGGSSSFSGDHYRVEAEIKIPGTSPVPVVVGALAPKMCALGGELAEGVATWLAGPRSLEQVVVPAAGRGAEAAGRPSPRVIAAVPVAVDSDQQRAEQAANSVFARYGNLPNYSRLFAREGVAAPAEVALIGNEPSVERGLQALFDAGATDVWTVVFDTGAGTGATMEFLKSLVG